jgi:UDP-2-acetamido-2,6-beta-L-arabino-hexul-4-ose reductase
MRIVITGGDGFIGRNLSIRLQELGYTDELVRVTRTTSPYELVQALTGADIVFHLAGTNRPKHISEFGVGNVDSTRDLCDALRKLGRPVTIAYTSSTQAVLDNPYGNSKRMAEDLLFTYGRETGSAVHIFRLTNVFGKWSRPNYNSAVATFCHNISHGLPITVTDPNAPLRLAYIDDVVTSFIGLLDKPATNGFAEVEPIYETTVGQVVEIIGSFSESRRTLVAPKVGAGFLRALHATYLSYLDPQDFSYTVPIHADERGVFVEILKTEDSGQFSYFTARPGITRGEHYHHTKTEKFLVINGTARFGFRQIDTGETFAIETRGGDAKIVETVPGWAHNITNIGDNELVCLLWANEIFDRANPDTIAFQVNT